VKRLAARTSHTPNDTHDHSEITASDVTVSGQEKRGLDSYILGGGVSVENLPGSFLTGIEFDYIAVTYPNTVTEVFTYKNGGAGGTTVATITVTYQTESKENLVSVEKS